MISSIFMTIPFCCAYPFANSKIFCLILSQNITKIHRNSDRITVDFYWWT